MGLSKTILNDVSGLPETTRLVEYNAGPGWNYRTLCVCKWPWV